MFFFRFFLVLTILTTVALSSGIGMDGRTNTANAVSPATMDGQNSCISSSSSSSSDSDSSDSDSDSSDSDSSGGLSGKQKDKIKEIYDRLNGDYGFSAEFIAGILGNWFVEGGIDPMATEGDSGNFSEANAKKASGNSNQGIGYGQWTFERHTQLVDFAKSENKDWWESGVQLDYMVKKDASKGVLKDLAKNASDDPIQNTIDFHAKWEISADSDAQVRANRGGATEKIWKYMKSEGMDGKKDESKIDKIDGASSSEGASSADTSGDEKTVDYCGQEENEDGGMSGDGKMGDSVKANGESGKVIAGNWEYDDIPKKYKKHITLPKFDPKYLEKPGNIYKTTPEMLGQCTELTWAYMYQLWGKAQTIGDTSPNADGNGGVIWKSYKNHGAKITGDPTVGYGFSSQGDKANASSIQPGHTGVVVGVMPDGKWIFAQYNVNPKPATSRTVLYSVANGAPKEDNDQLRFFSGVKGSKPQVDMKKKDD